MHRCGVDVTVFLFPVLTAGRTLFLDVLVRIVVSVTVCTLESE